MRVQISFNHKKLSLHSILVLSTILCTGIAASYVPAIAQYQDGGSLKIAASASAMPGLDGGIVLSDADAVKAFYAARYNEPYWMSDSGLYSRAQDMMNAATLSWSHGLNPDHYFASQMQALASGNPKSGSPEAHELELLLTESFVRYVRDLSGMRVDAASLGLRAKDWKQRITPAQALARLQPSGDVKTVLDAAPPQSQTYKTLQSELIRMTEAGAPDYEKILPISITSPLKPGQQSQQVLKIRERLSVAAPEGINKITYDDALAAAVVSFQNEHGVKPDGIIGPQTAELMNIRQEQKTGQLIANLERLRWAETNRPAKFVIVNIPAAKLWAIKDGQVAFDMDVIVGRKERPTKSFVTEITGVRLNPTWTVPPTIKKKDILPKLQQDPMYLIDKGIELSAVIDGKRVTVDPLGIDWSTVRPDEMHLVRLVQVPGSHNPLGKIRVLMPNEYDIYLHDTNQKEYFNKADRAQSSGCMRMQEPRKMAEFILESKASWQPAKLDSILAGGRLSDVAIDHTIPVYMMYYTAWMNDQGQVVFGRDIYGHDKILLNKLAKLNASGLQAQNDSGDMSNSSMVRPVSLN